MSQILTYKTSYFSNQYQILKDSLQIGKLYKTEWMGSSIDSVLNEQKFRFVSKGLLKPSISITNLDTNTVIGSISIKSLLSFYQQAILTLSNGSTFKWSGNNLFANDWKWTDINNDEIIFVSKEPIDLFRQNGTISFKVKNLDVELFITLGIHLRNFAKRKVHMAKIICFILLIVFLAKFF